MALASSFSGFDQVRGAALVDVDRDVRVLAEDGAAGAGVIEVDVREQDRLDVAEAQAAERELLAQHVERAGRAGIDQRDRLAPSSTAVATTCGEPLEPEIQEPYAWRDDRHRARPRVRCPKCPS